MKTLPLSLLLLLLAGPVKGDAFHTIAPGIILDEARSRIYLMDRVGRMCALALGQGTPLWRSADPAMPLGLDDGALIALDGRKGAGGMRLLAFDAESGIIRAEREIALPPEVRARARPGVADRFEVVAEPAGGALRLRWRYERKPLRGALAATTADEPTPALLSRAGSVTVSWRPGEGLSSSGSEPLADDAAPFNIEVLTGASRIPEGEGARLLAADGQAVLVTRAEEDPRYGTVFRWRVYRLDGSLLGELSSHYGSAPFLVREPLLLYRRNPIFLLGADGSPILEQGSRLIAWDLAAGRERWAFDVAERQHFGPAPP